MNLSYCAYTLVCVSFLSGCSSRPVGAGGAPPNFDRSVNPVLPLFSGWVGWALAHPEFGSSVNPIKTRGADYAHHITDSPPGFEIPAASLICYKKEDLKALKH